MLKINDIIEQLEDFELAALYFYRFTGLMDGSKQKVLDALKERNIDVNKIEKYLQKNMSSSTNQDVCPRCLSNKFYSSLESQEVTFSQSTTKYETRFKTCMICLYSEDKGIHKKEKSNLFSFVNFLSKRK